MTTSLLPRSRTRGRPTPTLTFELDSLLGYRLQRLASTFAALTQRELEAAEAMTLPEYRVLVTLHSTGSAGVSALQRALMLDKAWISRTVARLVAKGLAHQVADIRDARRTVIGLTPAGVHTAARLLRRAKRRQARILSTLSAEEVSQLFALTSRIQARVDALHQREGKRSTGAL